MASRSLELKKLILENIHRPSSEIVQLAVMKLGYEEKYVYSVIGSMDEWADQILDITGENAERYVKMALALYLDTYRTAVEMDENIKHPSSRVGLLRVRLASADKMMELLQNTGIVGKVADKKEVTITHEQKKSELLGAFDELSEKDQLEAIHVLSKLQVAEDGK